MLRSVSIFTEHFQCFLIDVNGRRPSAILGSSGPESGQVPLLSLERPPLLILTIHCQTKQKMKSLKIRSTIHSACRPKAEDGVGLLLVLRFGYLGARHKLRLLSRIKRYLFTLTHIY
jgi:hypothetical protein